MSITVTSPGNPPASVPPNLLPNGSFEQFSPGPPYTVDGWISDGLTLGAGVKLTPGSEHSLRVTKEAGALGVLSAAFVPPPYLYVSARIPVNVQGETTPNAIYASLYTETDSDYYAQVSIPLAMNDQTDDWQFLDMCGLYIVPGTLVMQLTLFFPTDSVAVIDIDGASLVEGYVPVFIPA